ncbi:divergent CRAL/TRIO domain protein (macronuclear) [Tetrahymena thermophila SB210]|uniref:Divergent CRAL/TRIO domain protein n=1 Tax=Tetrahymena thermophila (strain SB210) TaxID=312017 RepID=I7LZP9_TETTS|nr:divergent CRAL/TRIO domain protein [Tetrahymena thermophila SB210]EAR84495.1 divergent CRAL/TRIO domain protein [Tetrahymena thermophila SB210]|eukprot:XP_001032158.1 divergent CRAL/TRIO domain protein [Tetrahymena thermophila SB210]
MLDFDQKQLNQPKNTIPQLKNSLNEAQILKFKELKQKIIDEAHTLLCPKDVTKFERYTEDNQAVRLLWAQDFHVEKAFAMWQKWISWRLKIGADDIKEEDIAQEYQRGRAFWHGKDKQNNPCLVVKVKNHIPGVSSDIMVKYVLFLIEEAIQKSEEAGTGMISIIWDREGFSIKNVDYKLFETFKSLNQIIQDNYAERIQKVYILYPNWFFKTIYALVKPFLTERTKQKVLFVDQIEDMTTYFEPSELLIEHGGTSPYKFNYQFEKVNKCIQDNELQSNEVDYNLLSNNFNCIDVQSDQETRTALETECKV